MCVNTTFHFHESCQGLGYFGNGSNVTSPMIAFHRHQHLAFGDSREQDMVVMVNDYLLHGDGSGRRIFRGSLSGRGTPRFSSIL